MFIVHGILHLLRGVEISCDGESYSIRIVISHWIRQRVSRKNFHRQESRLSGTVTRQAVSIIDA